MKKICILLLTLFFFAFSGGALYHQGLYPPWSEPNEILSQNPTLSVLDEDNLTPPVSSSSIPPESDTSCLIETFPKDLREDNLISSRIVNLDDWSIKIDGKTFFSRYKESYVEREGSIDTDREFKFYWRDSLGKETELDVPLSISYSNHLFQDLPVEPYPSSELGNALAIETPYGVMIITSESKYYESVEGVDGYNYYLITAENGLVRLNNNPQSSSIAFCGKADFSSGDMYYLQLQKNSLGRSLCYIDLKDRVHKNLITEIDQYDFSDKIFFSKYDPTVPSDIYSNPYWGRGCGLYECERDGTGVKEILSLQEYVVCHISAFDNYILLTVVDRRKNEVGSYNEKCIVYNICDGSWEEVQIEI